MPRDSFIFYRSFFDTINIVPEGERLSVYHAIIDYALNDVEPSDNMFERLVFTSVKPQIDANNKRHRNGCKGGAPKKNQALTNVEQKASKDDETKEPNDNQSVTKKEPKHNQSRTKVEPNENENVNENVNENWSGDDVVLSRRKSVDVCAKEVLGSQAFIEYIEMTYHISAGQLEKLMDTFVMFLKSTDDTVKSVKDFKLHLMNWIPKNIHRLADSLSDIQSAEYSDKIKALYPENNGYMEKVFNNYIIEHNITAKDAYAEFENAKKSGKSYFDVLLIAQTERRRIK